VWECVGDIDVAFTLHETQHCIALREREGGGREKSRVIEREQHCIGRGLRERIGGEREIKSE